MQNLGLLPSSHTYDGFIRAVAFPEGYEYGMTLVGVCIMYKPSLSTFLSFCSFGFFYNDFSLYIISLRS